MGLLRKSSKRRYIRHVIVYFLMCCMLFNTSLSVALAGPEGAQVVNGQVSFQQSGNNTVIHASDKSIINYSSFDIARPEIVEFVQPSRSASVLNRILSASPTHIDGTLLANGRVFFVNPAGVIIGSEARINVNQLVASGLNMSNSGFLNGQYEFAGGNGAVVNNGDISAQSVYLVGKQITNAGSIKCPDGYVVMAAGDRVLLGQPGSNVVVEVGSFEPPEQTNARVSAEVTNEGTVDAAGGTIILAAAGDVLAKPIMANIGSLSTSATEGDAGNISLQASEGQIDNLGSITAKSDSAVGGTITANATEVVNSGTVDVSGTQGGTVTLEGTSRVGQFGTINADGVTDGGGNVDLRAGEVVALGTDSLTTANAGTSADGGEVIVCSDGMADFSAGAQVEVKGGSESGDGGFFEVSCEHIVLAGDVDVTAENGQGGTILLDPATWTVESGSGTGAPDTVSEQWIEGQSQGGSNIELAADYGIFVEDITGNGIILGGSGNITFRTVYNNGKIEFEDNGDTIQTTTGDIFMLAGNGSAVDSTGVGIDIGNLKAGKSNQDADPGTIYLYTNNGGNIITGNLSSEGGLDCLVSVNSDGYLTVGGVIARTTTSNEPASSTAEICLRAEGLITINGNLLASAHGLGTPDPAYPSVPLPVETFIKIYSNKGDIDAGNSYIWADSTTRDNDGVAEATINMKAAGSITLPSQEAKYPRARADGADFKSNLSKTQTDGDDIATIIIEEKYSGECPDCPVPPFDPPEDPPNNSPTGGTDEYTTGKSKPKLIPLHATPDDPGLLDNDSDPDPGDEIEVCDFTQPTHGSVVKNTDGTFTYTPPTDLAVLTFTPVDDTIAEAKVTFTYTITDGEVDSDPITVTITLQNYIPKANPDDYTVVHDNLLPVTTSDGVRDGIGVDSDGDGDLMTVILVDGGVTAKGGTITLNDDGSFDYEPPKNWKGTDSFGYYVTDTYNSSDPTTVTISVTNIKPVANPDSYTVVHDD
ncbi:MAG: two-partner secretion domain-containing protein, partial [Planctomycetota bacterium]